MLRFKRSRLLGRPSQSARTRSGAEPAAFVPEPKCARGRHRRGRSAKFGRALVVAVFRDLDGLGVRDVDHLTRQQPPAKRGSRRRTKRPRDKTGNRHH